MSDGAQTLPWWMISAVRLDTLSHQSSREETMSRETGDPVDLFHFDPWLREMDCGCSHECETEGRWGCLWNPESLEGFWQCAMLTCQWESLAGWKCSAGKRPGATVLWHEPVRDSAGRRMSRETDNKGTRGGRVGGKDCLQQMMAPLVLLWSQTDAILELLDSGTLARIQTIGFPWINRCSPFTARTPDCLHKIFLPLSSWNVFTGNNN